MEDVIVLQKIINVVDSHAGEKSEMNSAHFRFPIFGKCAASNNIVIMHNCS